VLHRRLTARIGNLQHGGAYHASERAITVSLQRRTHPLGARALYLGNTDYRIHGTNDPTTIGKHVSSGCIRLRNADVIDLYNRVGIGAKVIVLPNDLRSVSVEGAHSGTTAGGTSARPVAYRP
jgi:L,D-transpeptidase catalytic domain